MDTHTKPEGETKSTHTHTHVWAHARTSWRAKESCRETHQHTHTHASYCENEKGQIGCLFNSLMVPPQHTPSSAHHLERRAVRWFLLETTRGARPVWNLSRLPAYGHASGYWLTSHFRISHAGWWKLPPPYRELETRANLQRNGSNLEKSAFPRSDVTPSREDETKTPWDGRWGRLRYLHPSGALRPVSAGHRRELNETGAQWREKIRWEEKIEWGGRREGGVWCKQKVLLVFFLSDPLHMLRGPEKEEAPQWSGFVFCCLTKCVCVGHSYVM